MRPFTELDDVLGIVFGIAFATLLMAQQISIFVGIIGRTGSQIKDVRDADIWVMDPNTHFVDEVPALAETDLQRVRVPHYVGQQVDVFLDAAK